MTIFYVVGPDGDTLEVTFIMDAVPELLSLPPETFALLEQNLKKYVKWEVNVYGQQLEFMQAISPVHFKKFRSIARFPKEIRIFRLILIWSLKLREISLAGSNELF